MITGFTKTAAGSNFTPAEIEAIFNRIKLHLATATIIQSDDTTFTFGPAGTTPGDEPDDTPYSSLQIVDRFMFDDPLVIDYRYIHPQAYIAPAGGAVGVDATVAYDTESYDSPGFTLATFDSSVHFACNPLEGWWWIAAHAGTPESGGGHITVCTPFTRVADDMRQGIHARFGLILCTGSYKNLIVKLPYTTSRLNGKWSGTIKNHNTHIASPYGIGGATRQAGSALPRGIAPAYPMAGPDNGEWSTTMEPAVFGDARCAMMATDGYAWAEEAAPGWRVFGKTFTEDPPTTIYNQYMALRSPAAFDVLT